MTTDEVSIRGGAAASYSIPTDTPEADGTFAWKKTTLIVVTLDAGEAEGIGYTYSHQTCAPLIRDLLKQAVIGAVPFDSALLFSKLRYFQRNYGREGLAATALSAIDIALWDLKAKLLKQPLVSLLGKMRDGAPVYGSGGFTSYSDEQLRKQFEGWVSKGIPRVKMKVGSDPARDPERVRVARDAIGPKAELFVDANGAYSCKQAIAFAERFASDFDVTWFEEPVSSDDLKGLRLVSDKAPGGMDIAAGEYGWTAMSLRSDAGGGVRGCVAGGCDALRRGDRLHGCGGAGGCASASPFGALRAIDTHAPGLRGATFAAPGVFSRSRTH